MYNSGRIRANQNDSFWHGWSRAVGGFCRNNWAGFEAVNFLSLILSGIVAISGAIVFLAWLADYPTFKSLSPDWVTMKISTALGFVFAGISATISNAGHPLSQKKGTIVATCSFVLMAIVIGVRFGVADTKTMTVAPGQPSLATILGFSIVAVVNLMDVFGKYKHRSASYLIVAIIGAIAMVGYLLERPGMYYYHPKYSTAMAIHTAALFVALGISGSLGGFSLGKLDEKYRLNGK